MKLITLLALLFIASPAFAYDSGIVVWADASEEDVDTGDEVCAYGGQPPQYFLVNRLCVVVFVPGSATEVGCDVEVPSGYFYAFCQ